MKPLCNYKYTDRYHCRQPEDDSVHDTDLGHHRFQPAPPSDATQPAADDRTPSAAASPTAANENSPNEGADASQAVRTLPYDALEECSQCPFNQQFHVDGNVTTHKFQPAVPSDEMVRIHRQGLSLTIPSWLVAEAAKAIEMHLQAKGCRCDLAEDGVCPFFVGWWGAFSTYGSKVVFDYKGESMSLFLEQTAQLFYALVKEK